MEGSRIFLTSTVYNKLTLSRTLLLLDLLYSILFLPLLSSLEPEVVTDRIIFRLVCLILCDP